MGPKEIPHFKFGRHCCLGSPRTDYRVPVQGTWKDRRVPFTSLKIMTPKNLFTGKEVWCHPKRTQTSFVSVKKGPLSHLYATPTDLLLVKERNSPVPFPRQGCDLYLFGCRRRVGTSGDLGTGTRTCPQETWTRPLKGDRRGWVKDGKDNWKVPTTQSLSDNPIPTEWEGD